MPANMDLLKRITAHPDGFGGKPVIRDLRVSVELILSLLAQRISPEVILHDYPGHNLDDTRTYSAYAHAVVARDTLATIFIADP